MEDRRVYVDTSHHVRQKKAFALLIVAGLALVLGVWFLQLRMMFDREIAVDEFQKDLATFSEGIEGTWSPGLDSEMINIEDVNAASAVVSEAMQDALAKQQAQDAVAASMVTQLNEGTADDTASPTSTAEQTTPTSDAVSE